MKTGRRFLALLAAAMTSTSVFGAEINRYESLMASANAAFENEDWPALTIALDEAQSLRPYSLFVTRNRILAYALMGEREKAREIAEKVAERGLSLAFSGHPALTALAEEESFKPVIAMMADNLRPRGEAKLAFAIADSDLLPEIVVLNGRKSAFVGSVRTGHILSNSGVDFAVAPGGVYGLEKAGGDIWAVANARPPFVGPVAAPTAGFYSFNTRSGAPSCRAEVAEANALLGAIEKTPRGLVASDSATPRIFLLAGCGSTPRVLAEDPRFVNLQGVAYDRKRKRLYVADYLAGLFSIDLNSGAATPLKNIADAHLGGIDGLYSYKSDLIGIQNGVTPQRIVRIKLDDGGLKVRLLEVLQQALPDWREPTNGEVVGDELYYVATSNWPAYDDDGAINDDVVRAPVRVMIAPLN